MQKHIELQEQNSGNFPHGSDEMLKQRKQNRIIQLPKNLDFRYKRLIFWIPVVSILVVVFFAIIHRMVNDLQKYYCFKSVFQPTGFQDHQNYKLQRQMLVNTRYTFSLYVDPLDNVTSKAIAENGTSEPQKINLIGHIIKQGDNVLIAGQQVGLKAVIVGKVIGKKGMLHVLTRLKINYNLITKNLQLNSLQKNTKLYKIQASDRRYNETVSDLYSQKFEQELVEYQKIDDIIPINRQLNFIYINSQQLILALLGMKNTIIKSTKLVIMVNWKNIQQTFMTQNKFENFIKLLSEKNYTAYTYKGGSHTSSCKIGNLISKGLNNLYTTQAQTLLFFPPNYKLPK